MDQTLLADLESAYSDWKDAEEKHAHANKMYDLIDVLDSSSPHYEEEKEYLLVRSEYSPAYFSGHMKCRMSDRFFLNPEVTTDAIHFLNKNNKNRTRVKQTTMSAGISDTERPPQALLALLFAWVCAGKSMYQENNPLVVRDEEHVFISKSDVSPSHTMCDEECDGECAEKNLSQTLSAVTTYLQVKELIRRCCHILKEDACNQVLPM